MSYKVRTYRPLFTEGCRAACQINSGIFVALILHAYGQQSCPPACRISWWCGHVASWIPCLGIAGILRIIRSILWAPVDFQCYFLTTYSSGTCRFHQRVSVNQMRWSDLTVWLGWQEITQQCLPGDKYHWPILDKWQNMYSRPVLCQIRKLCCCFKLCD